MALEQTTAASSGIWGAVKGALSIFSGINKAQGVTENTNPDPIDEYESSYSEIEVISLTTKWKRTYESYYGEVEPTQRIAFEYWIGMQKSEDADAVGNANTPLIDNKIFESVETFIPIATRANPDPLVQADPNELGQRMSSDIKQALIHEADRQKLRKILKRCLRNWVICRLGIIKVGYNMELDRIETTCINPKRMIFDKDGHWDESGYFTGEYIGEKKTLSAATLCELFPKKKEQIMLKAKEKKGTKIEFIEWWYRRRDTFYTLEDIVLGKFKNSNWNWDANGTPEEIGEDGKLIKEAQASIKGVNHFDEPHDPYVGLSIFSTGLQPHDETSLILQNIGIQDMINRRWKQIDRNVEGMNNGIVVSDVFTDSQASQAASALRRGIAIRVPGQDVDRHVKRFPPTPIPSQVFDTMRDGREELRNIFGTSGSTPEGVNNQDTVRGKILVNQLDSSRIGGGVGEYLEQVADTVYNWWVQMMFVHYDDEHYFVSAGTKAGGEIITIKNQDLALLKTLDITVKEGSLIPKDPLTQRNEAIDLWSAEAIDPITLFTKLEYSDPDDAAEKLLKWQLVKTGALPPQAYLPNFQVPTGPQQLPQQGVGGPAVNTIDASTGQPIVPPTSGEAVSEEGKQLLQSIPVSQ